MFQITDINELKITKIRHHRINFRYNNILYSLNLHEDGGDHYLTLWKNYGDENISIVASDCYYTDIAGIFLRVPYYRGCKAPWIYSHVDKQFLADKLNWFVKEN